MKQLGIEELNNKSFHPIVKWIGGKTAMVPNFKELYNPYRDRRFIDLFAGGLSISLGLLPKKVIINDINPYVINLYRQIREGMKSFTFPMLNEKIYYYKCRDRFNYLISSKEIWNTEVAQLFYYLNQTCFNGLCRFNKKGAFNAAYGKYKKINYYKDLSPYYDLFGSWDFRCEDFEKIKLEENDFIYADPPYDQNFTKYNKNVFTWEDQIRLAECLSVHRGPVVVSNSNTDRIVELYSSLGFKIEFVNMPRRVNCDITNRKSVLEMLAKKNIGE